MSVFFADCHETVYIHSYDRGTSIYLGLKVDLANRQVFATDTYYFPTQSWIITHKMVAVQRFYDLVGCMGPK